MVPAHRRQCAPPTVLQSRGAQSLTSSQVRLSSYPGPWPVPEVVHAWPFYGGVTWSVVTAQETVVPLFVQGSLVFLMPEILQLQAAIAQTGMWR